nr:aphidicolan-16b-ol synthase [Neocamarosporium betae]
MVPISTRSEVQDGLIAQARSLITRIVHNSDDVYGFGTLSCTVYDTAWVALVTKHVNGIKHWLFPESFHYILASQCDDGTWCEDKTAQFDGVLNTIAGLLVLKRYRRDPLQLKVDNRDLDSRIKLATSALHSLLEEWDVSTTNNVGFEIIVPTMLDLLVQEDPSLSFELKGREALTEIREAKMNRFQPELLYQGKLMTLTHSLEALLGRIDYDNVARYTVKGSMFASPSSTAAYLMSASTWDDEAETYLRYTITASTGKGSGGVPGVFPTTYFEYTWILSTLFRAGFQSSELDSPELTAMTDTLLKAFKAFSGAIGLDSGIEPDVDDSAKIVTTLNMLGKPAHARYLCDNFEVETHFRVYPRERDPSFSANCNALAAFLHQPDVEVYSSQILKAASYLCERMWNADEKIDDKWNKSHLYSSFLYTQVMTDLMAITEAGRLDGVFTKELLTRVCVTIFQSCLRAMLKQSHDGSWNQSLEETAYAILHLTEARRLCFFEQISEPLENSIYRGITFLTTIDKPPMEYLWSDKVSYGSAYLAETYVLAARRAAESTSVTNLVGFSIWKDNASTKMHKLVGLFHRTPLLKALPKWELQASMIEASIYQGLLQDARLEVLQRPKVDGGEYLSIIPFTWTSCSNSARTNASASHLWELMALSFFTYQVDEFMEAVAGPAFKGRMTHLHAIIDEAVHCSQNRERTPGECENTNHVTSELLQAVRFILDNPTVRKASPYDRNTLLQELRIFLHAHVTQVEDNASFGRERLTGDKALTSYRSQLYRWVHTISSDHIAGPFCFYYATCLLGATLTAHPPNDCFPKSSQKYLAAATCRHLSCMCRMYNDIGSWNRDHREGNLNCLHFPEFSETTSDDAERKASLLTLAQYERKQWCNALQQLEKEMVHGASEPAAARLAKRRACLIDMFCKVTDLYGQIYVLRDVSSVIKDVVRNGE